MMLCKLLPGKLFHRWAIGGKADSDLVHSFFAAASVYQKNVYPRQLLTGRQMARFAEGEYPIVREYDRFLTQLYGDWRTLPPEEDRICKQHAILVDLEHSYECYADYRDGMEFDVYTRSIR